MNHRSRTITGITLAALAVGAAACGSDDSTSQDPATTPAPSADTSTADAGPASDDVSLVGICPDTIVVQTDWLPQSEHGEFYRLTGEGAVQDDNAKSYTSPLYAPTGEDTGVKIEIRAGGPAIGFQQAVAQMYADPDILMAIVTMDQAIQNSENFPSVGIVAPRRLSPQIIMWDPATYPDAKTIADIGQTDARVLYFGGSAYMDYLTGQGILNTDNADGSYDGSPATFVASNGAVAQQGYATAEPFQYENEFTEWMKPVAYQLIADTGYNPLAPTSVRPESIEEYGDCFTKLVPMFQQAYIDYLADPAEINALVSKLTDDFQGAAPYSVATADFAVETQLETGIVGNNPGGFGSFDLAGIQELIDISTPIFEAQGTPPVAGLTPESIVTNQFIDPTILLPE